MMNDEYKCSDIIYFDYMLHKMGINKKYLQYVSYYHLKVVLLLCNPGMTYKKALEYLNKDKELNDYSRFTNCRIKDSIMKCRKKCIQAEHWAEKFGIKDKIESWENLELNEFIKRLYEKNHEREGAETND